MLQIKRGNKGDLGILSLFFSLNICGAPSLQPSRRYRDGSNEGEQHMTSLRNLENIPLNYPQYPLLSGALRSIRSRSIYVKQPNL